MDIFHVNACIFDFDGTLVDSMSVWRDSHFCILRSQGIDPPIGLLRTITPLGDVGVFEYFRRHFCISLSNNEMQRTKQEFAFPYYRDTIPAKSGAVSVLQLLRHHGISCALLTASPHTMFEPCLQRLGLFSSFDFMWSSEDFGLPKSDPQIYRDAAQCMGFSPSSIAYLDDNLLALRAAKAAGLKTIGVFDETSAHDEDEIRKCVCRYIYSLEELVQN